MFRDAILASMSITALAVAATPAHAEGGPKRGAPHYRACVACHSLEPGTHLTGPSLAGAWGRRAGKAADYIRYSEGLKKADFEWDEITLNAWLADPQALVPGTYMVFPGIKDDSARADLIAFLALAMAPGGDKSIVEKGLAPEGFVIGQKPDPVSSAPPEAQVTAVRHCRDSYFITTANGVETPYWEMNVRLKLDTRSTGPEPGKPVIMGAGMMGDRVSVLFSAVDELSRFVVEKC